MSDRVTLLERFGEVPPWLADRVRGMSFEAWRWFYDLIEAGTMRMPVRLEDTMPRNDMGLISNPEGAPSHKKAVQVEQWAAWSKIWGDPPWEVQRQKQLNIRPRMPKFKD